MYLETGIYFAGESWSELISRRLDKILKICSPLIRITILKWLRSKHIHLLDWSSQSQLEILWQNLKTAIQSHYNPIWGPETLCKENWFAFKLYHLEEIVETRYSFSHSSHLCTTLCQLIIQQEYKKTLKFRFRSYVKNVKGCKY